MTYDQVHLIAFALGMVVVNYDLSRIMNSESSRKSYRTGATDLQYSMTEVGSIIMSILKDEEVRKTTYKHLVRQFPVFAI